MITIEAPAKINLALQVTGQRADGYHLMRMVNFSADHCDVLTLSPAPELSLSCENAAVPAGDDNLIMRVARRLQKTFGVTRGARMHLTKRIPMQAGLAGGSADAAAALRGLTALWELPLAGGNLYAFGAAIGADIPYCCVNRPALVSGIGERVEPLAHFPRFSVLGVKPPIDIPTPWAFARLDAAGGAREDTTDKLLSALASGELDAVGRFAANAFEPVIFEAYPEIRAIRDRLLAAGARFAVMSGSGSTVIGYFAAMAEARAARPAFEAGHQVFTAEIYRPEG
ncbi:4-(cytidine 5'-diphospho)-2-C-methyl-D-erythritol kinase [Pseudoramibacter faecis]|uniref:4-(cytidine 5'-diphospho)-2-C-methyl-D-erythritol kinase n=1 Tax=Pseudoramibacter faecis TaxID=3108534 RepID=UPI002E779E02|nr:4-(cytidine 5'-diphospho)-2-C-methyl-D-erythritol kinase [Pseudoramibacter sp. HA2172]